MASTDEPISIYGVLFGETGDWTIGGVSGALRRASDLELIHGMGLASTFAFAFHVAFGDDDDRTVRALGAMGAIGNAIEHRGYDPMALDLPRAFDDWCDLVAEGGADAQRIPTHRLSTMRTVCRDALSRLASEPEAKESVERAVAAINALLGQRGAVADGLPGAGFQA